jgi:hypothetical protein
MTEQCTVTGLKKSNLPWLEFPRFRLRFDGLLRSSLKLSSASRVSCQWSVVRRKSKLLILTEESQGLRDKKREHGPSPESRVTIHESPFSGSNRRSRSKKRSGSPARSVRSLTRLGWPVKLRQHMSRECHGSRRNDPRRDDRAGCLC